eukprot:TRINITY_DN7549_c0_g1_i1.p1 TRINITY_DN7549_c0_g1~~TRINITY_DN7549_c0_g1_i1.p1  ORF type:complete len:854 (-),score=139.34 TRINITY_DN7549_c0_g1_i1:63-2576(-)
MGRTSKVASSGGGSSTKADVTPRGVLGQISHVATSSAGAAKGAERQAVADRAKSACTSPSAAASAAAAASATPAATQGWAAAPPAPRGPRRSSPAPEPSLRRRSHLGDVPRGGRAGPDATKTARTPLHAAAAAKYPREMRCRRPSHLSTCDLAAAVAAEEQCSARAAGASPADVVSAAGAAAATSRVGANAERAASGSPHGIVAEAKETAADAEVASALPRAAMETDAAARASNSSAAVDAVAAASNLAGKLAPTERQDTADVAKSGGACPSASLSSRRTSKVASSDGRSSTKAGVAGKNTSRALLGQIVHVATSSAGAAKAAERQAVADRAKSACTSPSAAASAAEAASVTPEATQGRAAAPSTSLRAALDAAGAAGGLLPDAAATVGEAAADESVASRRALADAASAAADVSQAAAGAPSDAAASAAPKDFAKSGPNDAFRGGQKAVAAGDANSSRNDRTAWDFFVEMSASSSSQAARAFREARTSDQRMRAQLDLSLEAHHAWLWQESLKQVELDVAVPRDRRLTPRSASSSQARVFDLGPPQVSWEAKLVLQNGAFYFRQVEKLQTHSTGTVFRYESDKVYPGMRPGETVAIKATNKTFLAIEPELKLMQALKHPQVVRLLDCFQDAKNVYFVMEPYGKDLLVITNDKGGLTENVVADVLSNILHALTYVHDRNVVHMDVCLTNILAHLNVYMLIDFGKASFHTTILQPVPNSTAWKAPEAQVEAGVSFPVDIWSMGNVVVEALTCTYFKNNLEEQLALRTPECKDFADRLLSPLPTGRPTAAEALNHCFVLRTRFEPEKVPPRVPRDTEGQSCPRQCLTAVLSQWRQDCFGC